MDLLFYFPQPTELGVLFKLIALIGSLVAVHWLLTLIIVNTAFSNSEFPRELDVWRAQLHATIWTFVLLHIYILALLNWNLGIFGLEALSDQRFYLRFIPEFALSIALMGLFASKKRQILQGVKLEA